MDGFTPWPKEFADRYRAEGYWRGQNLGEITRRWSSVDGDRIAIITEQDHWSYAEVDQRADRLAAGLHRIGVRAGDRVVVQLPNTPEFIFTCLALFRLGAMPVFALTAHRRNEIEYFCRHAEAVAYIVQDSFQRFDYRALAGEILNSVPAVKFTIVVGNPGEHVSFSSLDDDPRQLPGPNPGDVAFFLLSGGTTGLPKLIPRTHDDYAYQLRATAEGIGFNQDSVYLAALPAAHNAALGCPGVLGSLLVGARVVLCLDPTPDRVFPLIERHKPSLTTLMPQLVVLWLEAAAFLGLKCPQLLLQVGGAMLDPDTARRVRPVFGSALTHWFGMSEGFLSFTRLDDPDDTVFHTQGRPLAAADEIRVVDEDDRDVEPGAVGHLLVRGPYTLRGYYKAEQDNKVAFTHDGYLRSMDLVRITANGSMVVTGRLKDVINRGGEKVSAEEIEGYLAAHPDIAKVAIVAIPDSRMGEKSCAFVVPAAAAPSLRSLKEFLRSRGIAEYKMPDRLEIVEAFPQTKIGKVDKAALKRSIAQGGSD